MRDPLNPFGTAPPKVEPQPVHNDPTIVCCDLWPRSTLTQAKMDAYKRLIDLGDIKIRRVVHHKATGYTTVEYWSNLPHAWTLNKLRELAAVLDQGTQMEVELSSTSVVNACVDDAKPTAGPVPDVGR